MKTASKVITNEARVEVERAITDVESRTRAEIVAVVATRSGNYDRSEDVFGLLTGLVLVAVAAIIWREPPVAGSWSVGPSLRLGLGPSLLLFTLGTVGGAWAATMWPVLARPFITRRAMLRNVMDQGTEAFGRFRIGSTARSTGVLIYVSLLERTCWVVGDDAVTKEVDDAALAGVRDAVVAGFRAGRPGDGLRDAITRFGALLAAKLPTAGPNPDELPNALHVLD